MAKVRHNAGEDLKVRLKLMLEGQAVSPKSVRWEAKVWVGSPQMAVRGGWDGEKATGSAQVYDDYALMAADAPPLGSGTLKGSAVLYYPDSELPDGVYTKEVELYFVGEGEADVRLEAFGYYLYEIALREGYEGTRLEWLASMKGEKGDPFTWADMTPEMKAELKGDKGDTGDAAVERLTMLEWRALQEQGKVQGNRWYYVTSNADGLMYIYAGGTLVAKSGAMGSVFPMVFPFVFG